MDYKKIFTDLVDNIKSEGRYRSFFELSRCAGRFPIAYDNVRGREIILWCINDYLGMGQHPVVIEEFISAAKSMGVGSGGTRNIGGNNHPIVQLEHELADLHHKESALVFTSGYVANQAALVALAKIMPELVFFSDESNHASIIEGIRNSKAEKYIFRHNDIAHLEGLLREVDVNRPKLIVFESAYSMDGLASPMQEICLLAKKYNALTYIDEVHTVGLYGERGAGLSNKLGCDQEIDIIQGTLSKGFGVMGGYITGSGEIIDAIRSVACGFIFTTALPPAIAQAARASVRYLKSSDRERLEHQKKVALVKNALRKRNIPIIENNTHIVSVLVGDPKRAREISLQLLDKYGMYLQHINYPTVPKGTERLRITPTPMHNEEMIEQFADALAEVMSVN